MNWKLLFTIAFFVCLALSEPVQATSKQDWPFSFLLAANPINNYISIFTGSSVYWAVVSSFLVPNVTTAGTDDIRVDVIEANDWTNATSTMNNSAHWNASIISGSTSVCIGTSCKTAWPGAGSDTDTNASSICSAGEVLGGNTDGCLSYAGWSDWDECADMSGCSFYNADMTAINTPGPYLYGGATSGAANLYVNGTVLNETIDQRETSNTSTEMVAAVNNTALNVSYLGGHPGSYYLDDTDTDTNASSICSNDEVLLGNGSCVSSNDFFDDTTITDTDTNASSICSADQVLLGNGSCVSSAEYYDDTTIPDTDTNASSICSSDQVLLGNGSCVSSATYFDDTDTYNVTGDFQANLYISNCTEGEIWKADANGDMVCDDDSEGAGGGGGAGMWADAGTYLYPNTSYADNIYVKGYIKADDWTNISITESQVSDADWWDADGDISNDEISEAKINFGTACTSSQKFYLNGNDLACNDDVFLSQEQVDDYVNNLISDADSVHTRITITYDDSDNAYDFVVDDMSNSTADIQAVSVGGEVSGTVGSITLDNDALDDQYVLNDADDTKSGYLWITETDANALLIQSATAAAVMIADTSNRFLWTATLKSITDGGFDLGTGDGRYRNIYFSGYLTDNTHNTTAEQIKQAYDYATNGTYLTAVTGTELDNVWSSNGILTRTGANTYSQITDSHVNWDNAFAWANANHTNWDTAYLWGDHSAAGYLTSYTDTNASSICSGDEILLGNTSCVSAANYLDDTTIADSDTNASSICSGDEILLGNTSCVSAANYLDDTTIADSDTNASSICSGDEILLGNTSCVSAANYLDDTTIADSDTNASSICSDGEFLNGDGSCDAGYLDDDGIDDDTPDDDSEVPDDITINTTKWINTTLGYVVGSGYKICLDGVACTKYIHYNGTHVVIQG